MLTADIDTNDKSSDTNSYESCDLTSLIQDLAGLSYRLEPGRRDHDVRARLVKPTLALGRT